MLGMCNNQNNALLGWEQMEFSSGTSTIFTRNVEEKFILGCVLARDI